MRAVDVNALRCTPAYPFAEAAHYLDLPVTTLRAWCVGTTYLYKGERRPFESIIDLDGERHEGLSFLNLVEAHVLVAIRRHHKIPLPKVREAILYVSDQLKIDRPLAHARFQTDGVDLLVEQLDRLVNVSKDGQLEMVSILRAYLQRIERDPAGVPIKLFPFTRKETRRDAPAPVEINPRIAFGRPVLVGRGVPTAVLADRFKAGDTLADLATDYDASTEEIEEAIRCEIDRRKAA
jgi:uncharacterized protein (DUF433 family)